MLQIKPDREYTTQTNPKSRIVEDNLISNGNIENKEKNTEGEEENVSEFATQYLDKFYAWGEDHE